VAEKSENVKGVPMLPTSATQ